jgi:hypothetical protein
LASNNKHDSDTATRIYKQISIPRLLDTRINLLTCQAINSHDSVATVIHDRLCNLTETDYSQLFDKDLIKFQSFLHICRAIDVVIDNEKLILRLFDMWMYFDALSPQSMLIRSFFDEIDVDSGLKTVKNLLIEYKNYSTGELNRSIEVATDYPDLSAMPFLKYFNTKVLCNEVTQAQFQCYVNSQWPESDSKAWRIQRQLF